MLFYITYIIYITHIFDITYTTHITRMIKSIFKVYKNKKQGTIIRKIKKIFKKKHVKGTKTFQKKKKTKSTNILVSNIEIFLKKKRLGEHRNKIFQNVRNEDYLSIIFITVSTLAWSIEYKKFVQRGIFLEKKYKNLFQGGFFWFFKPELENSLGCCIIHQFLSAREYWTFKSSVMVHVPINE